MSISSIVGNKGYSALLDNSNNEQNLLDKLAEEKAKSKTGSNESIVSPGRKQLRAYTSTGDALASLKENGIPITRESVATEIERRELQFQLLVSSSLKALGIDEDIEFKITLDDNGKIIVNSSHEDKDKVQNFFDSTPELAEKFKNLESLKNLSKSMERTPVSMTSLRKSIQLENMDSFFRGMEQASYSSLILSYSKSSILSLAGIDMSV